MAKRDWSKCPDCHETIHGCSVCMTDGVCECCPCECFYNPEQTQRLFDAADAMGEEL
jgi:hypothetical protein